VRVVVPEGERQALAAARVPVTFGLVDGELPRLVVDLDDVAPEELDAEDAVHGAAARVLELRERGRGGVHVSDQRAAHVEGHALDLRALRHAARAADGAALADLEAERPHGRGVEDGDARARVEDEPARPRAVDARL
jgi:hypothetical protein